MTRPFVMTPVDMLSDRRVSRSARDLFQIIERFTKMRDECCTARNATLARIAGTSIPTVSRNLAELERLGMIRRCMDATGRVRSEIQVVSDTPTAPADPPGCTCRMQKSALIEGLSEMRNGFIENEEPGFITFEGHSKKIVEKEESRESLSLSQSSPDPASGPVAAVSAEERENPEISLPIPTTTTTPAPVEAIEEAPAIPAAPAREKKTRLEGGKTRTPEAWAALIATSQAFLARLEAEGASESKLALERGNLARLEADAMASPPESPQIVPKASPADNAPTCLPAAPTAPARRQAPSRPCDVAPLASTFDRIIAIANPQPSQPPQALPPPIPPGPLPAGADIRDRTVDSLRRVVAGASLDAVDLALHWLMRQYVATDRQRSQSCYADLLHRARRGELPADALVSAYEESMKPAIRNPGAMFVHRLNHSPPPGR